MKRQFILRDGPNAQPTMVAAWGLCKELFAAGQAVRLTVQELKPNRSLEQNDKLHAICADVAKQREWAGRKLDTEGWKRLFVDAWARETDRLQAEIVPSLDGKSVVTVGLQTRSMTIDEVCELIEWMQSWAAENNVELIQ